jgi:hypothetical protein
MKKQILTTTTLFALSTAITVRASEGGTTHYISGTFSDFTAVPPSQPGLYLANYFVDYGNATANASKEFPFGIVLAAGLNVNVQGVAPTAAYVYPFKLGDVALSSAVAVPYEWEDIKVTATFNRNGTQRTGALEQSVSGLGDIEFLPVMASWTNGDFTVGGMFNVYAPSGAYNADQLISPGLGYWTLGPVLTFSWLSTTIGTEFTAFTGVDFNTENPATSYKSGDTFHVDATLAQHLPLFGGFVGVGASGFYLKQFTGDSGSGARLGSFELESAGVGPTLSYAHAIGKSMFVVDASWLPQLDAVNTVKGNYFWLRIAVQF